MNERKLDAAKREHLHFEKTLFMRPFLQSFSLTRLGLIVVLCVQGEIPPFVIRRAAAAIVVIDDGQEQRVIILCLTRECPTCTFVLVVVVIDVCRWNENSAGVLQPSTDQTGRGIWAICCVEPVEGIG